MVQQGDFQFSIFVASSRDAEIQHAVSNEMKSIPHKTKSVNA